VSTERGAITVGFFFLLTTSPIQKVTLSMGNCSGFLKSETITVCGKKDSRVGRAPSARCLGPDLLLPFFLLVEIARTPSGQTSEVLLRVAELHRLRRDPLRDISRKSKPPSAWIQGRNTCHSVRCVCARTNVCADRRELTSSPPRVSHSYGNSWHSS
jgi:hypothetical protein